MALEKELETYGIKLPELLSSEGKFVVIGGGEVAGTFSTYEDALKVGYDKFGLESFLVKRIEAVEIGHYFTRDLIMA